MATRVQVPALPALAGGFQSIGVTSEWRLQAEEPQIYEEICGFQSIGVTSEWRQCWDMRIDGVKFEFPINRRHQRVATIIRIIRRQTTATAFPINRRHQRVATMGYFSYWDSRVNPVVSNQ